MHGYGETYGISNIINKDIVFIILELIRFYLYIKNKGEYGDLIYKSNKNRYHGNRENCINLDEYDG